MKINDLFTNKLNRKALSSDFSSQWTEFSLLIARDICSTYVDKYFKKSTILEIITLYIIFSRENKCI